MSEFVFKLPDLGEGAVEAEIIAWHVRPGDVVAEDDIVADIMTDKANVEVPAPVAGTVLRIHGEPGDKVAVGAELIAFDAVAVAEGVPATQSGPVDVAHATVPTPKESVAPAATPAAPAPPTEAPMPRPGRLADVHPLPATAAAPTRRSAKVVASPAVRRRAAEAGINLALVPPSGPRGRTLQADVDAWLAGAGANPSGATGADTAHGHDTTPGVAPHATNDDADVEEIPIIGVRRVIAERMAASKRNIPHFSYVEEVDVTELERLRRHLNETEAIATRLTLLPFVALALIHALRTFPQCNAHFDAEARVLRRFRAVHLGVATHTGDGLKVPVVRDAERLDLNGLAAAIQAAAAGARGERAERPPLSGSTITLTSLGALGGIVSTPVINAPEVAIIGVNKAVQRPVVVDGAVVARTMMNLSSSFDHRAVDGMDAARLIRHVKARLEHPATLFM